MKAGKQEFLFSIEPDDTEPTVQQTTVSVPSASNSTKLDMESASRTLEDMADKLGSFNLARTALDQVSCDDEAEESYAPKLHSPGKPIIYPRIGNVRDFHDGGRADEYRGGFGAPEYGTEAFENMRNALPDIRSMRDRLVQDRIRKDFEAEVQSCDRDRLQSLKTRALARYRAYLNKHYQDQDVSEHDERINTFANTLQLP